MRLPWSGVVMWPTEWSSLRFSVSPSHCATLLLRKTELDIYNTKFLKKVLPDVSDVYIQDWLTQPVYHSWALMCWWIHNQNLPKSRIDLFSKCQFDCISISDSICANFSPYIFATTEPHFPLPYCLIYSNKKYCQTFPFFCCISRFLSLEIGKHRHQVSVE